MVCFQKNLEPCGNGGVLEINENNIYRYKCPVSDGVTVSVSQSLRYEVWVEDSLICFHRRNFGQCVSSASTALERFHEVVCKIAFSSAGYLVEELHSEWVKLGPYSERQLGAFQFSSSVLSKTRNVYLPTLKLEKYSKLRNNVVHSGIFPSEPAARDHCVGILKYIVSSLAIVEEKLSAELGACVASEIVRGHALAKRLKLEEKIPDDLFCIVTLSLPYRISRISRTEDFDFDELVKTAVDLDSVVLGQQA